MPERHLPQVRIFDLDTGTKTVHQVEKAINEYIVDIHTHTGNIPEVSQGGNYVIVKCDRLMEVRR